ncbi:protein anon-73B1-like [Phlebotomus argentipes]|uniref:protein anon-73B1-like n=1 Tax=Phlebotomus argentipes TaxID=94469 RepID=UPI0028930291|nr:protein anon-73B1-like [Phlebotomus argentipes]
MSTVDATLALGASEDFLNKAIRIGLYLSATFQVICLTTIIFLPTSLMKCFNGWDKSKKLDESDDTSSEHSTPQNDPKQRHHQRRKQEKKKRK